MKPAVLESQSTRIFNIATEECITLSVYDRDFATAFPLTADKQPSEQLDLCTFLRPNFSSTFVFQMQGDSMTDAHVPHGSLVIIDRSIVPTSSNLVLARVGDEYLVRKYIKNSSGIRLMPANDRFHPIPICDGMEFEIWGTVIRVILDVSQ